MGNFLGKIGESSSNPPSCGSTRFRSRLRRRSLLGDLISSALCDLTSLKVWLAMKPPGIPSIGPALDKIGAVGSTIEEGGSEQADQDKTLSDNDNPTRSPSTSLYSTIAATTLSSKMPSSKSILSPSTSLYFTTSETTLSTQNSSSSSIISSTLNSTSLYPTISATTLSSHITSLISTLSSILSSMSINDTLDPSVVTGFPFTISMPTMVANALSNALFVMLASEFGTEMPGLTISIANTSSISVASTVAITASHSSPAQKSITSKSASTMVDPETAFLSSPAPTTRSSLAVSAPSSNCFANNCLVNTIAANIVNATYLIALSESASPAVHSQTLALGLPTSSRNLPKPTTSPAAFPAVESYNIKGSSLCNSIGAQTCRIAYFFYNPDNLYFDYTAYVAESASSIMNDIFGPFASNGCTAMLKCHPSATGLFGKQIIAAFDYLFTRPGFGVCRSIYLENGCELTLDACNDYTASVPCEALPVEDQPDHGRSYPCYFPNGTT